MKKKDPTITIENDGCTTIFILMIVGILTGIILGVSACSKNERLEKKLEEIERKNTSHMSYMTKHQDQIKIPSP